MSKEKLLPLSWITIDSQLDYLVDLVQSIETQGIPVVDLIKFSRDYEPAYTRWEYVRREAGSEIVQEIQLTGFEGYYAGLNWTKETVATDLATFGVEKLEQLLHRYPYRDSKQIITAISNPKSDFAVYQEWLIWYAALMAKLRGRRYDKQNTYFSYDALARYIDFRDKTDRATNNSPYQFEYDYSWNAKPPKLSQKISLPCTNIVSLGPESYSFLGKPELNMNRHGYMGPNYLQVGYRIMTEIGKVGHPLARAYHQLVTTGTIRPVSGRTF